LTTRVTSISNIFFLLPLVSSKINFLGIDNDNIITAINMRSKIRFVFVYMKYYNLERLHSANGDMSPMEYENSLRKVSCGS
jgi:hypothetical protein